MIRVTENYCIDVDEQCYTVNFDKHQTDKKGNHVYVTVGYYGTLENAIKGVIKDMNKKQLKDGEHTLKEALTIVKENNNKFTELLREVTFIKGEQI